LTSVKGRWPATSLQGVASALLFLLERFGKSFGDRDEPEKLHWFHLKGIGEFEDTFKTYIRLSSFNPSNVIPVYFTHLAQLLLRQLSLLPQFANLLAEWDEGTLHDIESFGIFSENLPRAWLHHICCIIIPMYQYECPLARRPEFSGP